MIMVVGIVSLAVPLSTTFAGEFLILAGVFQQGWIWAVFGAGAIVLAAMYMLRAISGVLHQDVGPAVDERATDLRLGELAIVVPLTLCLLGLSAWPNLISGRASGGSFTAAPLMALTTPTSQVTKTALDHSITVMLKRVPESYPFIPEGAAPGGWTRYAP
jgi:NADH:ubiquinone oxidoreductase subunit 4 (subunit M)